ncbi:MAG: AAA family ATPase [Legionellales bacterium]
MILSKLRFSNFQSFGEDITELSLQDITFLIGPNGSGKTAVLQGLRLLTLFGISQMSSL